MRGIVVDLDHLGPVYAGIVVGTKWRHRSRLLTFTRGEDITANKARFKGNFEADI